MSSNNTHPIGQGTVNVSVNMEKQLSDQLGRAAFVVGSRSKGEFIREAIRAHLKRAAREGAVGALAILLWLGAAVVAGYGIVGAGDQNRRRASGGSVRIVRSVRSGRKLNKEGELV